VLEEVGEVEARIVGVEVFGERGEYLAEVPLGEGGEVG